MKTKQSEEIGGLYLVVDLVTGNTVAKKRTLRSAEQACDAFRDTWAWIDGRMFEIQFQATN